ncbi:hypothetical protein L2E82_50117 [Cichorium intybus]|nr:hypothetical protein L2E82_50117 [Cichorium intybus]
MLISGKNTPNSIPELPKAIFHQIEPGDAWGNVWRLQSNPVNTFTIPKSSRLLVDAFRVIDYGDITMSSEQEPGTRNLGVPNTELTSGICSSDSGRHVIKRDGQLRACPLVVLGLFVMSDQILRTFCVINV